MNWFFYFPDDIVHKDPSCLVKFACRKISCFSHVSLCRFLEWLISKKHMILYFHICLTELFTTRHQRLKRIYIFCIGHFCRDLEEKTKQRLESSSQVNLSFHWDHAGPSGGYRRQGRRNWIKTDSLTASVDCKQQHKLPTPCRQTAAFWPGLGCACAVLTTDVTGAGGAVAGGW